MKSRHFIFVTLLIFSFARISAQEQIEETIEKKLESIAENTDDNIELTELYEQLLELTHNPININESRVSLLVENYLINDWQYRSLMEYKRVVGRIQSTQELQFLEGFSREVLNSLEPFIYAGETKKSKQNLGDLIKYGRHQLYLRHQQILQKKDGYSTLEEADILDHPSKYYFGSPSKFYSRYKFNSGNKFTAGFVIEKDAGEPFFTKKYKNISNQLDLKIPSIDFSSFHFSLSNTGIIQKFVMGDYHLQFAQGLTMWSNFAFNKSSNTTSVNRAPKNIIASTSSIENNFFRGAALSLSKGSVSAILFYSLKNRDANVIEQNSKGEIISFSSLQNSGLHRTINELKDRNKLREQVYGSRLTLNLMSIKLGNTLYVSEYNAMFLPSNQAYKKFDFTGTRNVCMGFDYQWNIGSLNLFGEYSMSKNKGYAYLMGLNFYLDSYSKLSLMKRDYEAQYQNLYANAFAENSYSKNEKGLYLGFDSWIFPGWQIQAYLDIFKFPWLKSSSDGPSKGLDFFLQINHKPSDSFHVYLKYKRKNKELNSSVPAWTSNLVNEVRENIRMDLSYDLNPRIRLRSRAEWVNFSNDISQNKHGFLIFQQVTYSSTNQRAKLHIRFTNFNTDTYDTRIYTYENDLLYSFSIPAFYDQGNHAYLLLKYTINSSISCWMKLAHTFYANKETIGSGTEKINGSGKSELKLQMRIQF